MGHDESIPPAEEIDKLVSELVARHAGDHRDSEPNPALLANALRAARQASAGDQGVASETPGGSDDMGTTIGQDNAPVDDEFQLVIAGYRDLTRINHGAQGALYGGVHEKTNRRVAVKILWGGVLASDAERARFQRESDVLAALEHPFIVRIMDRGRTSTGLAYMVMDYVEGQPLDDYMSSHPQVRETPEALLGLFLKITEAIGAAHEKQVTHRDLKPSNIRIDRHGNPRILDFGLARNAGEKEAGSDITVTTTGQFVGSIPWASPEQAEGRHVQVGAQSDVYSLGMLLYYMLTGSFPFKTRGSTVEVLDEIVRGQRDAPSKARQPEGPCAAAPWIDARLDAIVLRAIAIDQRQRFASSGDLSRSLRLYLADNRPKRPVKTTNRLWAASAAVAVVTAIIVLLTNAGQSNEPPSPAVPVASLPSTMPSPSSTTTSAPPPLAVTPAALTDRPNVNEVLGNSGGAPFTDKRDGHLVGLRVWKGFLSEHKVITGVQPLFRTEEGVVEGAIHGRRTDDMVVAVAADGWAVCGMTLGWGQRIDGLALHFVDLETGETYISPWLGGKRGDTQITGAGAAAVGLRGRAGDGLDAIGLIFPQ